MRYIQSSSDGESFLPKELLCLFFGCSQSLRISCWLLNDAAILPRG
jgi:hypothetical protein